MRRLDGSDLALDVAAQVGAALEAFRPQLSSDDPVLQLELALLFDHLDRAGCQVGDANAAVATAMSAVFDRPRIEGLQGGLSGIGWMAIQVLDVDDACLVCDGIDEVLLARPSWNKCYDLLHGLVGIGVYALERMTMPLGDGNRGAELAERVLAGLEQWSRPHDAGLVWWDPPELIPEHTRGLYPSGWYNLGLAHGIPGVIGLLARMISAGFETSRARQLLDGAMAFMLGAVPRRHPRFPAALRPEEMSSPPSRLAWCYGDPGVAVAMWSAAHATERPDWRAETIELAVTMATRTFEDSGVKDTGLCHGSAGLALIFHRLHRATGLAPLGEAASTWLARTLAMRSSPDEGFAGFDERTPDGARFLTGATGTALALVAITSDDDFVWDRRLLTDVERQPESAMPNAS